MEKPIKVKRYNVETWETPEMDAMRNEHCMCHHCAKLKPGEKDNCEITEAFYEICKSNGNAFILTRCANWKEE